MFFTTSPNNPIISQLPFLSKIGLLSILILIVFTCTKGKSSEKRNVEIYQTSESGDNLKRITSSRSIKKSNSSNPTIEIAINPDSSFQEIIGFGASFTESSAWNLATIPISKRKEVLNRLFNPIEGAGFSLTRTHINSCDYSNIHYTYVKSDDEDLSTFSIEEDMKGFTGEENAQVKGIALEDSSYDLIPMIQEAKQVPHANFNIIASPWSPPSWMKTGETAEMTNGTLQSKYYETWAKYLSMYISAYKEQGIELWGLTPQNEPLHAHDARWDSNGFTPEQGRDFLKNHLGPILVKDGHLKLDSLDAGLRVLIYDHNKSTMNEYVTPTYEDKDASQYAWGTAFHWYASSELQQNDFFAIDLQELANTWPHKGMIHTESSIDIDANDPIGQYWRESTDYAGKFVPFDTYVYDIITNLNHGAQGYIEWCIILSNEGKPNLYDNFNSAPVLINPTTDEVIYTPLYYLLSHFSKFIRPKAKRIQLLSEQKSDVIHTVMENPDGSIVCVLYNKSAEDYSINLQLEKNNYSIQIGPRTLQTVIFQ